MIRIHNSLTGEKQELRPIEPGHVRMYSCGVTVYDYFHVGNARMLVVFDMVSRYLRHRGLRVTYVRNITDVDDKIINRAREAGVDWREWAARYAAAMHEDLDKLGCLRPEKEPKASEYIDEMLAMIGQLIANGYAYQATNGDVMYDVHKFAPYGQLSGKRLEDLRAGARVGVDGAKRDPLDFVLWKSAKPGEPAWPSSWGEGRPGWHIECSAMSTKELGQHFDIHGGGLDLKFPHHENEIAQTCGATGGKFAEIWMHNGFLNIDNEKMSKSLGNFFTTREVLAKIKHPEVLRFFLLSSHYRGPMNYSPDQLAQAEAGLNRLYTALRDVPVVGGDLYSPTQAAKDFDAAMDDDFNTPEAIAVLQGLARELNTARAAGGDAHHARLLAGELRALGAVLGVLKIAPEEWFRASASATAGLSDADIDERIAARAAAKSAKNWPESDRIRKELAEAGVILEDKPGGVTTWRRG
ncbi:MAG TPA: cysteine--tRNA ligase [Steroidobacteraceae bacterium]|nr:cysteine--tRNA ligase [Steroidobacteraceae bacterium]